MASTKRPTKIPSFNAKIPSSVDPAVKEQLNAVIEALDVRLGRRGDPIDRAITLRELIESGLAKELASAPFDPNNIRKGTFGPVNQFQDLSVPPQPTGVTATGGYSLITVFWDFPLYGNHSQTEIWRNSTNVLGNAILIGTSGGRSFVDSVGQSANYYYWVRHVSTSNVPGPWNATSGINASTAANVTELLSVLSGAITNSQLTLALKSRIDLIDASPAVVNSVAYQVAAEAAARTAAITATATTLQSQINAIATVAPYNGATAYVVGNQVTNGGFLYQCVLATTGNAPPNATYWLLLGAYTSLGAAVAGNSADIVSLNTVTGSSSSANANALFGLQSTVNDGSTGLAATRSTLLTNYSTTTSMNTAISTAILGLASTTSVNSAIGAALANYTTTASLVSAYYTKTATDAAISAAILSLVSTTALSTALSAYATTATLTTNYSTTTDMNSAISAAVSSLASTTYVTTQLSAYTNTASLTTNYYTKTATDGAIAAAVTTFVSASYVATQLSSYTTTASLTTNYYTKTQTDSAISGATSTFVSASYVTTQLAAYTTTASLTTNYYTKTQTDSAISGATSTFISAAYVTSALGSYTNTAALSATYYTKASAAVVEAQYFIKLNVNGRVSGFGISSDTSTGSQFVILADRFSIVSPYSDVVTAVPFIVQATSVTVGGVSVPAGVYMSDAFIMNGTIVNSKIANAAIDDAKIASLSANKITTGTLDTSRLNIDGSTLVSVAGVLMLGNVYVDNLVAGSITTSKLIGAAVNNVVTSDITTPNTLPTNATFENIDVVNVVKEVAESSLIVDFQLEATCTGSGNYALFVYVKVDGVIQSRLFGFFMTKSFASTVQGKAVITGLTTGTKAVQLAVQANVSGAGVATCTVNSSTFIITEVKR
jgi:hypothetical protein